MSFGRSGRAATSAGNGAQTGALTLVAMSLGFCVVQLDVTIVNTALNSIGASVGGGVAALQWVVNTYTIGFAALILSAGALGDRIGARRVFMAGFAVFTLASLACALAPSLGVLIAARAVQGLGAAILVPNSLALLNHAYRDADKRGRAVGMWAAGASLALTAGPLVGGGLIAVAGWRSIFLVNLPIGLFGLWLTWRHVAETPRAAGRHLDLAGQAAAIATLGTLAAAIIEGGKLGWTSTPILIGFAAAAILGGLFVLAERRAAQPMLPLGLFANRRFSCAALIGLMANAAFYGLIFVLSLYFQRIQGLSPLRTGLAFLPMLGMVLPVNILAPRLSERIGAPVVIAIGAAVSAAGALALAFIGKSAAYGLLLAPFLALGGGLGLLVPPLTSMLLASVDKARSGIASALLNSARQTGSVIGVALFGALAGDRGAGFIPGLHAAAIIAVLLLAGAAVLALAGAREGDRKG